MIYLLLLAISFTLTYLIKNYYIKNAILDEINERSSHTVPTPHGGGIALSITWFIGLIYLNYTNQIDTTLFYALLVGIIISVVSFFDDIYELSPKVRIITQLIVSICGLVALGGLETLEFGIFNIENQFITNIVAIVAIIWFINLYNFLDGINGYAGSEAIFLSLAGFILFGGGHFLVLTMATLGFLYWNWNKAKIFMGDSGSLSIGFIISVLAVISLEYIHPISILYLTAIPILDTLVVMVRRIRRKQSPFKPDKTHIHHIMVKFFDMNVKKTVGFLVILQIVFSSIGYMILDSINKNGGSNIPLFAFFGFMMMFVLFYMIFTGIQRRQIKIEMKVVK